MKSYLNIQPEIRKMASLLCGPNTQISFPVIDKVNQIIVEKVFVYPFSFNEMRTRPFGCITFSMTDGLLLKYENSYLFDFINTEEYPFDKKISYKIPGGNEKSISEYQSQVSNIFDLYESIRRFAFKDELTTDQKETLSKYYLLFNNTVPPTHMPFYQALSQKYMNWVKKHID